MKYVSTRGGSAPVDFLTACLAGLAPDGGLYVPESYPQIARPEAGMSYPEVAAHILGAFAGDAISADTMLALCEKAYGGFAHESVAPLVQLAPNRFLMELHHGPTLAFKDVAMQFIGQLYDWALERQGKRMTIICATSGDTGGAAAGAFAGSKHVDLVILHPHGRISPVQRLFMTTTGADNVHNFALEGDFDQCQSIVKALFAEAGFVQQVGLSGVNSINWARIAAQSVYYATAQANMGADHPLRFIVPSGNMGDALAGYVAARCGLLSGFDVMCAVNENDTLREVLETGHMRRSTTIATPSPAMDITVPSNLERVLFEASGRDADKISALYGAFAQSGDVELPETIAGPLGCMGFSARTVRNAETLGEMKRVHARTDWAICPHTAVGSLAAERAPVSNATDIVLATAHPAKFPETVSEATGVQVGIPARCSGAVGGEEVFSVLPADQSAVREHILGLAAAR
ncbi:MAG: threonine synthase [Hyphomonadaceae bacterium]|nr:threonine synthase [Hyphomonadaceae bacterium]